MAKFLSIIQLHETANFDVTTMSYKYIGFYPNATWQLVKFIAPRAETFKIIPRRNRFIFWQLSNWLLRISYF